MNDWLANNGFERVGEFVVKESNSSGIGVNFEDPGYVGSVTDWIYAITCEGEVKYIGETAQTLAQRIRLYYLESRTDSTNSSMRERLKTCLPSGQTIEIFAQKAPRIDYKGREIVLRVDLEISMIKELRPVWNKKGLYTN